MMLAIFTDVSAVVIAIFVIFAKFGATSAFNMCFIITSSYFPTVYNASVFGFTNLVSKTVLITNPIVSEMAAPIPMVIFCVFCLFSVLTMFFLMDPPVGSLAGSRKMTMEQQNESHG